MADNIINMRIQHKKDTSANWESANPVLRAGEIGFDELGRGKVGDGVKTWNQLPYINNDVQTLSPIIDTEYNQFVIDNVVYTISGNTITDDSIVPNAYTISNNPQFIIDDVIYTIFQDKVSDGTTEYPINSNQFSIGTAPDTIVYTISGNTVTDDEVVPNTYQIINKPYFVADSVTYTIDTTTNTVTDRINEYPIYPIGNIYTISPDNESRIYYYTITKNTVLNFESANDELFFVEKRIYITNIGEDEIVLALNNAEWTNDAYNTEWGKPGMHLYLQATWIGNRIIVEVVDNDQLADDMI